MGARETKPSAITYEDAIKRGIYATLPLALENYIKSTCPVLCSGCLCRNVGKISIDLFLRKDSIERWKSRTNPMNGRERRVLGAKNGMSCLWLIRFVDSILIFVFVFCQFSYELIVGH